MIVFQDGGFAVKVESISASKSMKSGYSLSMLGSMISSVRADDRFFRRYGCVTLIAHLSSFIGMSDLCLGGKDVHAR